MTDPQNNEILAFRRLVYRFSLKLTKEESRALVYIRLYDCKERYGNADTLEVLSKLETDCVFSPSNPEGLIEVAQDINRSDLQSMVKDFIKKRQRKAKANGKAAGKTSAPSFEPSESAVSEEELQLKAILEVTLSQAALFVKQVDILQQAITAGTKEQRQRAAEAINDAIRTAEALTDRLQKARGGLQHSSRNSMSSLRSSTHSSGSDEDDYYNLRLSSPETAQLVQAIGTGTETPTPKPRRFQLPIQESQDKPVQIPTKEAWYPAKDTHQQMVSPKTRRWTAVDSGSKSTPSSPLQTKQHVSQYKPEKTCHPAHEAHIHQQRTPKWTQKEDSGSKIVQPSLLQTKNSPRPKHPKPAVPPKPSRTATSVTKTVECPSDRLGDYTTLNPDIETDGSTKTGTDDSGFEEWKQHKFRSPIQKDTEGTEVHYYKSLRRDEVDADAEYQSVKH